MTVIQSNLTALIGILTFLLGITAYSTKFNYNLVNRNYGMIPRSVNKVDMILLIFIYFTGFIVSIGVATLDNFIVFAIIITILLLITFFIAAKKVNSLENIINIIKEKETLKEKKFCKYIIAVFYGLAGGLFFNYYLAKKEIYIGLFIFVVIYCFLVLHVGILNQINSYIIAKMVKIDSERGYILGLDEGYFVFMKKDTNVIQYINKSAIKKIENVTKE